MAEMLKIDGTQTPAFQVGLSGPQIKKVSSSAAAVRNSADSADATLVVATPTINTHAANKLYVDMSSGAVLVARQANTSASLPANTATAGHVVVSTAGTGAAIGDLLYDDGSATGNMTIIPAKNGRVMSVTVALTGGTVTFAANAIYAWDTEGTAWVLIGDVGSLTGPRRVIRYAITNSATQDSATLIPANARVEKVRLQVTTPYSGGASISIGQAGSLALLMATTDNDPLVANSYNIGGDFAWGGSALVVRTTIAGSPAAGAGVVSVEYSVPNA